jgi:hypothetical protein
MLLINLTPVIFSVTDPSRVGRILWSKLSTRSKVDSIVDVNDMVKNIVNSKPLQEWIEPGDRSLEAQVRRGVSFATAALLAGGDTTSKLAGAAVDKAMDWYMEYIEYVGPLVDRVLSSDGLHVFEINADAHLRYWAVVGTLRTRPFSLHKKLGFKPKTPMVDRIRVLSREGYLNEMREAILNDPQRRVDVTGGNSYYQVPLEADLAAERTRGDARLYQWCTVTQPDPAFAARTNGLEAVQAALPLGKWNAKPTWPARAAPTAAAAQTADVSLIALQLLQEEHGDDLALMPKETAREQLLARRVAESELQGPSGAWRQVATLRKMLLERGDRVEVAAEVEAEDDVAAAADNDVTDPGADAAGGTDAAAIGAGGDRDGVRTGGWACCTRCGRWRRVADPLVLPEDWECMLNPQSEYNSCDDPQEAPEPDEEVPFEEEDDDDFLPGVDESDDSDESEGEGEGDEEPAAPTAVAVAPAMAVAAAPTAMDTGDEATGGDGSAGGDVSAAAEAD